MIDRMEKQFLVLRKKTAQQASGTSPPDRLMNN
jgi:hypothetical protein